jgi:hypothetical protein
MSKQGQAGAKQGWADGCPLTMSRCGAFHRNSDTRLARLTEAGHFCRKGRAGLAIPSVIEERSCGLHRKNR